MRFKHRVRRVIAIATVLGAIAAPAAWAAPVEDMIPSAASSGSQDDSNSGVNAPSPPSSTPAAPDPVTVPGDGFDWGDAGIGATAMLALAAVAAGAALVVGRHPRRGHPAA